MNKLVRFEVEAMANGEFSLRLQHRDESGGLSHGVVLRYRTGYEALEALRGELQSDALSHELYLNSEELP